MGYKVKWVEDNLGISRKALRGFERMGLMPKNEDRQHRDYSEEDIERIWAIRVMQGIGFSLKEIYDMTNDEGFDFKEALAEKAKQLEQDKLEIERHLGYAKNIKATGIFPSFPKDMGTVRFKEFKERALNEWNINNDPEGERFLAIADMVQKKPPEEWGDMDIGRFFAFLEDFELPKANIKKSMNDNTLIRGITNRITLGASNPEVQLLVKMIYENRTPELEKMTPQQFARLYSSGFIAGDIARLFERNYGKEGCVFIADAVAIFGGYTDYNTMQSQKLEVRHGKCPE